MTPEEKALLERLKRTEIIYEGGNPYCRCSVNQENLEAIILETHRTAREEGRREVLEELKGGLLELGIEDGIYNEGGVAIPPDVLMEIHRDMKNVRKGYKIAVDEVAALIDARIGK